MQASYVFYMFFLLLPLNGIFGWFVEAKEGGEPSDRKLVQSLKFLLDCQALSYTNFLGHRRKVSQGQDGGPQIRLENKHFLTPFLPS